jgi:hypothetical protein
MAPETQSNPQIVSMSALGRMGRFGNQVFQYAFLRICAAVAGAEYQCPPWIGQRLFGHDDPPLTEYTRPLIEYDDAGQPLCADSVPDLVPYMEKVTGRKHGSVTAAAMEHPVQSGDLIGFFQFHTSRYAPHREFMRELFRPAEDLIDWLNEPLSVLRSRGKTVIAIHMRVGDFKWLPQLDFTLQTPPEWWVEWLDANWDSFDEPVLAICSDRVDAVLPAFARYNPVATRDLKDAAPDRVGSAGFYRDFYLLTQADVLCVSNSTFSFSAAMLNERAQRFVRPTWDFAGGRFVDFDPWNSDPLLRDGNRRHIRKLSAIVRSAYQQGGVSEVLATLFAYLPAGAFLMRRMQYPLALKVRGLKGVISLLKPR